jgi:DNA-binding winged helix-turn-helix (wHTH) protein/tetratricopeptide (TPR) repeat protein
MNPSGAFHFDGWVLDRTTGELQKAGVRMRLQAQPLRILGELLSNPGLLVTREQLIAQLWPQGVVDFDTALNSAMRRLRTALDDHADSPRYIETIPRRGYRFIGSLEADAAARVQVPVAAAPLKRRLGWLPATAILSVVAAAIGGVFATRAGDEAGTTAISANPSANEIYLRADHFFHRRAAGDLERARRYYEEALAIDPRFAEAWAGLASAYWIETAEGRIAQEQGLAQVRHAAERALALNPRLARAHVRLANYHNVTGDPRTAGKHLQAALELEPANQLVLGVAASQAAAAGRLAEAIELQRRALEAEPLSQSGRYNLAALLYFAGRHEEVLGEMIEWAELNPNPQQNPEVHALALMATGRFEEALALASGWSPGEDRSFVNALALGELGRRAESDVALAALVESGGAVEAYRIAEIHAQRGDRERAFEWLRTGAAHDHGHGWRHSGRRPLWALPYSHFLKPLQSDPRWEAWYEAARQPVHRVAAVTAP